jgi:hypothetical protein
LQGISLELFAESKHEISDLTSNDEVQGATDSNHHPDLKGILDDTTVNSIINCDSFFDCEDDEKTLSGIATSILVNDLELRY